MGQLIYILFVRLYPLAVRFVSLFNEKARRWVRGRKNIFRTIKSRLATENRERIWFHAASLGEFEQGKPVIERIKQKYPECCVILTFFSPSGYDNARDYPFADHIFYLPMDSFIHSYRFFRLVKPKLIFFIKYEFWYYYLKRARKKQIPIFLISAVFRTDQPFFKWYGGFHRRMLNCFTHLFVQDAESEKLLNNIDFNRVSISGDTRFDRVLELKSARKDFPLIEAVSLQTFTVVAGSTWTDDDKVLNHFVTTHPDIFFIIAPHDIGEERLAECEKLYRNTIRYSQTYGLSNLPEGINTIIIDNIGLLKYLYRYGNITYVGGGFGGDGVHNVLEPAVFGKPVIFGPVYQKFIEATDLIKANGAASVMDAVELEDSLNDLILNENLRLEMGAKAENYVIKMAGATEEILDYIEANRLFTN